MKKSKVLVLAILGLFLFGLCMQSCVSVKNGYCLEGDCENGYGVRIWYSESGSRISEKYAGETQNGLFHGQGRYVAYQQFPAEKESLVREGQWVAGLLEGSGYQMDEQGTYTGNFSAGIFHGQGRLIYPDGTVYEGEWNMGKRHGQVTYIKGTQYYKGDWQEDAQTGFGRIGSTADNSIEYEGEFLNGKFNGYGVWTEAGSLRHEGEFLAGRPHGYGEQYSIWPETVSQDGSKYFYKGDWQEGRRHGTGQFYSSNTAEGHSIEQPHTYTGGFENGAYHGEGTLTIYGSKFKGLFYGGFPVEGSFTWNDRPYFEIRPLENIPYAGIGRYTTADGKVFDPVGTSSSHDEMEENPRLYSLDNIVLLVPLTVNLENRSETIYEAYHPDGSYYRGPVYSQAAAANLPKWLTQIIFKNLQ